MAAMLNNPRSTERDNQNSLRKFPFADSASCTNGACVIPPGAVVDAQLYVPGGKPGRIWLSSVGTDGILRFSGPDGVVAETAAPAAPDRAVPVVFTGDGGPCPGGVVVFGRESEVSALRAYGGQSFTADQAELAPAAVAWPGLPGVCGFRLDDGHVVYGKVKMRGENGCVVATYLDGGVGHLRISAVGRTVESVEATGFITRVVATSDNRHFVVAPRRSPDENDENDENSVNRVVDIAATGLELTQDDGLVADREDLCAQVRKTLGTKPSERAAADGSCICQDGGADVRTCTITLLDDEGRPVPDASGNTVVALRGGELGNVVATQIPVREGYHFAGYFDADGRRYYRPDGRGVGRAPDAESVTLHARFIEASSTVSVTFDGYGTLHLAAPDTQDYANPIRISGKENPVPVVQGISKAVLDTGGAEAIADAIMHPSTPAGEVHIGLRGLGKASML